MMFTLITTKSTPKGNCHHFHSQIRWSATIINGLLIHRSVEGYNLAEISGVQQALQHSESKQTKKKLVHT